MKHKATTWMALMAFGSAAMAQQSMSGMQMNSGNAPVTSALHSHCTEATMMGYGYGMGGFWGFGMMAFWILVIVGVVLLIRWYVSDTRRGPPALSGEGAIARDHSLEIARERFAKGEITLEEYGAIRRGLEQ